MKNILLIFITISVFGCISESNLKPLVPSQILHSNSAKVWVLESETLNNQELVPKTRDFKTAFILYSDGEFIEQKMVHLGSSQGKKGVFYLTISPETQDTIFSLNYKNRTYKNFHLKKCTSKEIHLEQTDKDDTLSNTYWILKTLPKPGKWY